jgi:hypothetical protein
MAANGKHQLDATMLLRFVAGWFDDVELFDADCCNSFPAI